jgi:endonuclease/exonuclease/phosphatase family metal-dependent hydrolase
VRRIGVLGLVTLFLLVAVPASAAVAPAAAPAPKAPATVSLRVMSYNIHTGIGEDGLLDLPRIAEVIREARPDVVALQEVDVHWGERSQFRDQAQDLAGLLGTRLFFAPIYDLDPLLPGQPRRQYGNAILSRLPVLYTTNHHITRLSTVEPNPTPKPAPGFAAAVVLVHGVPIHVYSTHLDFRPEPAVRAAQVADMLRIMPSGPNVLIGDFNATPDAPELAPLWRELTAAPTGFTFPADVPVKRIDYVTVSSGVRVRSASVPETIASDHRPVVADLAVRRYSVSRTRYSQPYSTA